jgi:Transposase IS116/IS110/IS902 family
VVAILDELELTQLVTSIAGGSAVGAAAILAETGDPRRFTTTRAMVKHAGLAPREKLSGAFTGPTKLTGQGRPGLRVAAWRTVWGAQRANTVYAARYRYFTSREHNKLTATQAHTRDRRRDPASPARRHHQRHRLGSPHRDPRRSVPGGRYQGRLNRRQPPKRAVGASPTRR